MNIYASGPLRPVGPAPCCLAAFPEAAVQTKRSKIFAIMVPMQTKRAFIFYKTATDWMGFCNCTTSNRQTDDVWARAGEKS